MIGSKLPDDPCFRKEEGSENKRRRDGEVSGVGEVEADKRGGA